VETRLDTVHGNHGNRLEYLDYFPAFSMEMFCRNQAGQCPWKPWKKAGVFGLLSSLFHGNVLWKSGWTLSMETMEIGWSIWTTFQPFPWKCFVEIRLDNVHGNHGKRLEYLDYFPAFSMEMFGGNQAGHCPWKPWT
jgi:hypothetical protein